MTQHPAPSDTSTDFPGATRGPAQDAADRCSCADYRASRRGVLKGLSLASGVAAVSTTTGGVFRQLAFADGITDGRVLVVLSLRGGADALSMVVPYGDPAYAAARPRIAVPRSQLLAKDGFFGLHPGFEPLLPMWERGRMAAIHAVGQPAPNRSHFAAVEEIEDADPGSPARVGWLNRLVGLNVEEVSTNAMSMGSAMLPTIVQGPTEVLGVRETSTLKLPGARTTPQADWKRQSLKTLWGQDASALGRAGRTALDATRRLADVSRTQRPPSNGAVYPRTAFGDVMKDTARVLKAGLGVQTVTVDFDGWDMHTGVGTLDNGALAPMVRELARTLAAFYTDLGTHGRAVTVVTISEFGRRVKENGAAGLDHGYGGAMLVLGSGVRGGRVFGSWPGLGSGKLINGDLAVTRDYRSVLSEVLRSRTSADVSKVFPGFRPERALGFMA